MFRAYDSAGERLVAVKLFKLDLPPERGHQLVAEFERLIAADLTHPALTAPLATGISGVSAYLVQEYVAADSLDLVVREYGPAPAVNALRVAAQLAGALDFAAAVNVTHGGLHPRDVLLSSDDTRLTGIGITRALERIGVVAPIRRPYTAPERIAGAEWDRRADVFSLATLIHEMLWGRRVSGFGAQAGESLTEIEGADLAALRAVFARALAEGPAERFATTLELAEALRKACPGVDLEPEPAPAPKRRATREAAPRLPLDAEHLVEPQHKTAQDFQPPRAVDPGELRLGVPARDPQEGSRPVEPGLADLSLIPHAPVDDDRYRDVEAASAIAGTDIARDVIADAAAAPEAAPHDERTAISAGLIADHAPAPLSALERSRSAVWPLLLALVVGIAIGFAGGYGVGSREPRGTGAATAVTSSAAPVPAGREFTEGAVAAPPAPAATAPNVERKTQNSELKTQSSAPEKNLKSETSNLKSPAAEGRLLVRSRPAGARVSVDGKDYGRTPVEVLDLARGAHRLKIARDGYTTEERRVVITTTRPSQSLSVALERPRAVASGGTLAPPSPAGRFVGALVVDSRPAGAKVYVDGKLAGTTPMSLPSVPAGSHAIRLEHDGYRRWSSSVRVVASEQNRVTASLER